MPKANDSKTADIKQSLLSLAREWVSKGVHCANGEGAPLFGENGKKIYRAPTVNEYKLCIDIAKAFETKDEEEDDLGPLASEALKDRLGL